MSMCKFRFFGFLGIGGILLVGVVWATGLRNVAPDAVTKATEGYNFYTGELATLTDGKHPDNDESPEIFQWGNKGILVFELPEPVSISEVRVRVGENAAPYIATFYLGAKLGAGGQARDPEGERKGILENYEFRTHQWVSLKPESPVMADYIELEVMNGPEMYEVEILIDPIQPSSWGLVKARFLQQHLSNSQTENTDSYCSIGSISAVGIGSLESKNGGVQ